MLEAAVGKEGGPGCGPFVVGVMLGRREGRGGKPVACSSSREGGDWRAYLLAAAAVCPTSPVLQLPRATHHSPAHTLTCSLTSCPPPSLTHSLTHTAARVTGSWRSSCARCLGTASRACCSPACRPPTGASCRRCWSNSTGRRSSVSVWGEGLWGRRRLCRQRDPVCLEGGRQSCAPRPQAPTHQPVHQVLQAEAPCPLDAVAAVVAAAPAACLSRLLAYMDKAAGAALRLVWAGAWRTGSDDLVATVI